MSEKRIETKKLTFLGLMVGYSLILYIIEGFIPNPMVAVFPGAKLGLSNIITLVALMTLGFKDTFIILTVRIILSSIFTGNPMVAVFPGAKLGLSNIITLVALMTLGFKDTFIILTVRIILSSIFTGPMSYLMFSIGGGYLSLVVMYLFSRIKGFSTIGISVGGAIGHNVGQLLVASDIVNNIAMTAYLPFMLITSLVTGIFVGIVSKFTIPYVKSRIKKL